jgi:hypothetical protein
VARKLIVSTVDDAVDELRPHVSAGDEIKVVVPVVRQGILDWLANDERAFSHAATVAQETGEALPGETLESSAGEADVELAIRDAIAEFRPDEIVVAVHPDDEETLVESIATDDAPQRRFRGIPVRTVTISARRR